MSTYYKIADADNYFTSGNTTYNNGSTNPMEAFVAVGKGAVQLRPIMKFDLAGYTYGSAAISAAKLNLNVTAKGATTAEGKVYRVTRNDWTESGSSWKRYDISIDKDWATLGGDYTETDGVTFTSPSDVGSFSITGLANLVKDALNNRSNVLHIIIRATNETGGSDTHWHLTSKEDANSSLRPTLEITYSTGSQNTTLALGQYMETILIP